MAWLPLALVLFLVSACRQPYEALCSASPAYAFDRSGATPVLIAEFQPGMLMRRTRFEAFGDGRVAVTIRNSGESGEVLARHKTRVSADRLEEVLDHAVVSGLAAIDLRSVEADLRAKGRFPVLPTDIGSVSLEFRFQSFQPACGAELAPYSHALVTMEPRAMTRALPSIPEYQALYSLTLFFEECYRAADPRRGEAGP